MAVNFNEDLTCNVDEGNQIEVYDDEWWDIITSFFSHDRVLDPSIGRLCSAKDVYTV